jgi:hypothetical protein
MSAAQWVTGLACAIAVLVAGDIASEEIRGRLDRLPFAVLRLARSRLPAGLRERVHDQEWVPELQHVLQHAELFPLTRLLTGLRFAAGLLIHARAVAAELRPEEAADGDSGRTWRQRLATRSASMLHAAIWPVHEPLPVRCYAAGVMTAAAAATGVAAASVTVHARDLELCAILLACALIADDNPRARVVRRPLHYDLRATWFLPAAVLLPPLYALIIPAPLIAWYALRRPGHTYRLTFSAAACSLAYGTASALAHAAAAPAAGHNIPPGITPLTWVLVIAACELLAAAGLNTAILIAIKGSASATRVWPLLANRMTARYELAAITLGITATLAAAASPLLAITIIPAVIVATRRMTATTPGPVPAS